MAGTIGDAYVNIIPKAPGISGQMEDLLEGGASSGGKKAGAKIGSSMLGTLGKVVSVAAVGKIVKDAFSAGGNLEQSFGGLDTIYGDAAASAKDFAVQAASAGISANSYAEQAVSFGAALKQAFAGDTEKAMQAANTAIMDMADNSAKMGTDIGSIQTAYQGFAKQNYTMLDNLKLGYGGTKTEMERLLADAEKLSGVKYNIDNLGDVYDAIHVIQEDLGLTGVAAAEAETTLTGSFGAMKASWQNLLAAMTTGQGLEAAMENLGKSAGNVLKNVVRMAGNIAKQLPQLFNGLFSAIGPELMPAVSGIISSLMTGISTNLPKLLQSGADMLKKLAEGVVQALPELIKTATTLIPQFINGLIEKLPSILSTGGEILLTLLRGIISALPQILTGAAQVIAQFVAGVVRNLPQILQTGVQILVKLAAGAVQGIGNIVKVVPQIFSQLKSAFAGIDWAQLGRDIINGIKNGISSAAGSLFSSLQSLAQSALASAKAALQIGSPSKLFAEEVGKWIPAGIAVGIDNNLSDLNKEIQSMINTTALDLSRLQKAEPVTAKKGNGGITINQRIDSVPQTPVQLAAATAAYFERARWAMA